MVYLVILNLLARINLCSMDLDLFLLTKLVIFSSSGSLAVEYFRFLQKLSQES